MSPAKKSTKQSSSPPGEACEVPSGGAKRSTSTRSTSAPSAPQGKKPGAGWKWCPECEEWVKPKRR